MITIFDLFEYELFHQGKSPHTTRSYLSKIKYFLKWHRDEYGFIECAVSDQDVKNYVLYCRSVKKYSPGSIRQRLSAIQAYKDFLFRQSTQRTASAGRQAGTEPVAAAPAPERRSLARFAL